MRFWDSSALIPLVMREPASSAVRALRTDDPDLTVWWAAEVECASALARREREGALENPPVAWARLEEVTLTWTEIPPASEVRRSAVRATRTHGLRAADALQLAAALVASEQAPRDLPFVTLDERLADAARREGFPVLLPV